MGDERPSTMARKAIPIAPPMPGWRIMHLFEFLSFLHQKGPLSTSAPCCYGNEQPAAVAPAREELVMTYRTTVLPYGTTAADRVMGLVQASDALNRLRDRLHARQVYPSISHHSGSRLHVANTITVCVKPSEEQPIYCWRLAKRGAAPEEFEAPAAAEIDDVAAQIAATLCQPHDQQPPL
ncbi:hypothetical protein ACFY3V_16210 [Streptosporangium sp. NPDC000095]|uniref:hypothetical protein n=1 Tax=Streptosporangium sp. NPDC000095 TaxID=3366184 RepID=UPI0036AF84DD